LTRLLLRSGSRELSRTEAGLLATLADGPRRVMQLAETEALAQPTVTQLVQKLERRGLVTRRRSVGDARGVLVSVTAEGRATLHEVRAHYRASMERAMQELSDDQLAELVAASETLARLIETLQSGTSSA